MSQGKGSQEDKLPEFGSLLRWPISAFVLMTEKPVVQQAFLIVEKLHPVLVPDEISYDRDLEHLTLIGKVGPIEEDQPDQRDA